MLKILMIDDTKSVHAFVKSLLSRSKGIELTAVFNGQEAKDLLKTNPNFNLILLDWEMPVLDGPSTLVEFKKMGISIPIMMMTTKSNPEDIKKMLELGVSEYLMKPFTVDILFQKIEMLTGKEFNYAA